MVSLHLEYTASFKKLYKRLTPEIQRKVDKSLLLLESNPAHPSLNFKKMGGTKDIYEWRVTVNYRGTLRLEEKTAYLRKVGTHNLLRNP